MSNQETPTQTTPTLSEEQKRQMADWLKGKSTSSAETPASPPKSR